MSTNDPTTKELAAEVTALRTALAAASGTTAPTVTDITDAALNDEGTPQPGDILHCLMDGLVLGTEVYYRGQEVVVDKKMITALIDRDGKNGWPRFLDPEYQTDRFGTAVLARGPWPLGLKRWTVAGSPTWTREYLAARDRARSIHDPIDRAEAEKHLLAEFGPVPGDWIEPPRPVKSKWAY